MPISNLYNVEGGEIMALTTKKNKRAKGKRVESNRMDEPLRREFENSLGIVEIWGQDYPVASLMRTLHPFEFKMRYLKYLQDNNVKMEAF
jgi:hypothetical protein